MAIHLHHSPQTRPIPKANKRTRARRVSFLARVWQVHAVAFEQDEANRIGFMNLAFYQLNNQEQTSQLFSLPVQQAKRACGGWVHSDSLRCSFCFPLPHFACIFCCCFVIAVVWVGDLILKWFNSYLAIFLNAKLLELNLWISVSSGQMFFSWTLLSKCAQLSPVLTHISTRYMLDLPN